MFEFLPLIFFLITLKLCCSKTILVVIVCFLVNFSMRFHSLYFCLLWYLQFYVSIIIYVIPFFCNWYSGYTTTSPPPLPQLTFKRLIYQMCFGTLTKLPPPPPPEQGTGVVGGKLRIVNVLLLCETSFWISLKDKPIHVL